MAKIDLPLMAPVVSSNIKAIGYDANGGRLGVQFESGDVLCYRDVPIHKFTNLMNAVSMGRQFYQEIRGQYPCEKIDTPHVALEGECPRCGARGLALTPCTECECARFEVRL